jgi:hypothetical protein
VFVILCYCVCNFCVVYCFECVCVSLCFCELYCIVLCLVVSLPSDTYPLAVNNNNNNIQSLMNVTDCIWNINQIILLVYVLCCTSRITEGGM